MADLVCWAAGRSRGQQPSPVPPLSLPGAFAAEAIGARTGETAVRTGAPSGEQSTLCVRGARAAPRRTQLRGCD